MQNLVHFILKYRFTFLFIVLQLVAWWLWFSQHVFYSYAFSNGTNAIVGTVSEQQATLDSYWSLDKQNADLASENLRLQAEILSLKHQLFEQTDQIDLHSSETNTTFIKAKVIGQTKRQGNLYLTLNKGTADGISEEAGVLSPKGIVGRTLYVSEHYSLVMSVQHQRSHINVEVGSKPWIGTLEWELDATGYCSLRSINQYAQVGIGDSVFTNPYSTYFPDQSFVGTVETIALKEQDQFFTIQVKLNQQLNELRHVYVIQNALKSEMQTLENQIIDEY
ncbi:MAG: rod shape-determining protein MreC [Flavobacteriales bacterium]